MDHPVPLRASIDPIEIPFILPWLLLLEVVNSDGQNMFRYRLTGTGCRELFGIDFTGKMLGDDLISSGAEERFREFRKVVANSQAIYSSSNLPIADRSFINVYRGVFPVSTTGSHVDQIFVVISPEETALSAVRSPSRPHGVQARMSMR